MQDSIFYGSNAPHGQYVDVNDIRMYVEIYGEGQPLLLIHGNGASISSFERQIPFLANHFRVIVFDSRAQGRTTDSHQDISYTLMASDTVELMNTLNLGSAFIVGWSDGGVTGLHLALSHPEKVKKLVVIGANYSYENYRAPLKAEAASLPLSPGMAEVYDYFLENYVSSAARLSPEPEKLPLVRQKLDQMMLEHPNLTLDDLGKIQTPTLIMSGDHDMIRLEHTVDMFQTIPHAYLEVLPGASHLVPLEKPQLVNQSLLRFLETEHHDIDAYYFSR